MSGATVSKINIDLGQIEDGVLACGTRLTHITYIMNLHPLKSRIFSFKIVAS